MVLIKDENRLKDTFGNVVRWFVDDTVTQTFALRDGGGDIVDLSGKTIRFRANKDADIGSGTNKIFEQNRTLTTDGTDGKVDIALTPTELPASAEQEDAHLYLIDITGALQRVLAHFILDILPEPDAA